MDITSIVTSVIAGGITLIGVVIANQKACVIMQEQIKNLRREVEKHNGIIERVYKLEEHKERTDARLNKIEEEIMYIERRR